MNEKKIVMIYSLIISAILQISIYSFQIKDIDGHTINLSDYRGKKILIVNIASEASYMSQMNSLQALQDKYGNRLAIIAFPSNSFGKESKTNIELKNYLQSNYHLSFIVAEKAPVTGTDIHPLYDFLTSKQLNGMMDGEVRGNFQKFLINEDGLLIGRFVGMVDPLDSIVTNAIEAVN